MGKQNNQKKKASSRITYIIIIIVLLNVLSSVVPAVIDSVKDMFGDSAEQRIENLEIVSVSSQPILAENLPKAYGTVVPGDEYQLYQFEVTVSNQGNTTEMLQYSLLSLDGVDDYATIIYEEEDENSVQEDTRILPQGRDVTMTIYGLVSNDTTEVEVSTYRTPDGEKNSCVHQLE